MKKDFLEKPLFRDKIKVNLLDIGNEYVFELDKKYLQTIHKPFNRLELVHFIRILNVLDFKINYTICEITTLNDHERKFIFSKVDNLNDLIKLTESLKDEKRTFKKNKNGKLTSIKI